VKLILTSSRCFCAVRAFGFPARESKHAFKTGLVSAEGTRPFPYFTLNFRNVCAAHRLVLILCKREPSGRSTARSTTPIAWQSYLALKSGAISSCCNPPYRRSLMSDREAARSLQRYGARDRRVASRASVTPPPGMWSQAALNHAL